MRLFWGRPDFDFVEEDAGALTELITVPVAVEDVKDGEGAPAAAVDGSSLLPETAKNIWGGRGWCLTSIRQAMI